MKMRLVNSRCGRPRAVWLTQIRGVGTSRGMLKFRISDVAM